MLRNVFKRKIQIIMKDNQELKARDREKSGTINSKRLAKLETTNRLFKKKKLEKEGKDYFISILVDASGSMDRPDIFKIKRYIKDKPKGLSLNRAETALVSLYELDKVFKDIPGLHWEIVSFSAIEVKLKDYNEKFDFDKIITIYKDLGQRGEFILIEKKDNYKEKLFIEIEQLVDYSKGIDRDEILYYLDNNKKINLIQKKGYIQNVKDWKYIRTYDNGGTSYKIAILNSYKRMNERTGKKALLLLTDGDETYNFYGYETHNSTVAFIPNSVQHFIDNVNYMKTSLNRGVYKELYKYIQKYGSKQGIETYCIGIQTGEGDISHFKNYTNINNLKQLFPTMIKVFNKVFKKYD